MPYVEPSSITDVKDRKVQKELMALLAERSVLGYTFSYRKLFNMCKRMLKGNGTPDDDITEIINNQLLSCLIARNDKDEKFAKDDINERITRLYTENGIDKTLRHPDPFGMLVDYCMMEGTSSSFNKEKALQWAVRNGMPAETFTKMYAENTTKTPYVTLTTRAVKEKDGE